MEHFFCFSKVVIGGDLNAFIYSYKNNLPFVINKLSPPYRFEPKKESLWNKLYFILSLSGLNLLGDKVENLRIDEDQLKITTNDSKVIKIKFDEAIIFDDIFVSGLPPVKKKEDSFMVLDWMVAKPCTQHDKEHIFTGDNFVRDIYFYPTDRIDGYHPNIKDLVSISHLTEQQLKDFEHSDTYARFKTEKLLTENGITGSKNGIKNNKQITYALKLEVKKREIKKLKMNFYENTDKLKFKYKDELLYKTPAHDYADQLNNILNAL